jgi:hypothetical protein
MQVNHAIFCHSGFDETSLKLREKLGNVGWQNLDHFDETQMTEASIRRARRRYPPVEGTLRAPYGNWPIRADAADVIFGLLAIHELRNDLQRASWFGEAKRSLHADGCLVLVEHIRDAANFLAFGPGFLHFHSREKLASRLGICRVPSARRVPHYTLGPGLRAESQVIDALTLLLRIAGSGLILLALVHIPIGRHLKWREDAARLTPVNASIFRVHTLLSASCWC